MYRVLVQKPETKKLFGGKMSRREKDTQKYLKCTGWEKVEWFYLLQVRDKWCA
jgi:hypothetical protein